jgi:flavin reductase (DIM6/NTAB) family NADH-FMN oxidoreductase RutF
MKIEIEDRKPDHYREYWPGQYHFFSHYEYVCGVPQPLFLITTLKENGGPNACFHSWSAFSGDSGGFFAVMPGLMTHTHTYANILRDREFCVNFLSSKYYDQCGATIQHNEIETDELAAAGFGAEPAKVVRPPRVKEAFLSYECTLESVTDLSGAGISAMIVGRVRHASVEENFAQIMAKTGDDGFMYYIHSPKGPTTGEGAISALSILNASRLFNE